MVAQVHNSGNHSFPMVVLEVGPRMPQQVVKEDMAPMDPVVVEAAPARPQQVEVETVATDW